MLFNSIDFFVFFAVVCTQYFRASAIIRWPMTLVGLAFPIVQYGQSSNTIAATLFILAGLTLVVLLRYRDKELVARKALLLTASLLFYSAWRWPFTTLLLLSTVLAYISARHIDAARTERTRRLWITFSTVGNLGILCFFKYTNFLLENLNELLLTTGLHFQVGPYGIILPLGISFYTFQTMSYTIDVYRGLIKPRESILDVALYVSFFPQLVAGPIVRGKTFVPQLDILHPFDAHRVKVGLLLMIWGMARKLLVADALAPIVNQAYGNPDAFSGWSLTLATYCFAFQIYCDFAGYSDIAIGAARVLGFEIPFNFRRPYFATTITTFWRRWHISLSSWLRDYLYIPLGGSRCSRQRTLFNLLATMVLGGLWHGASWNFVIWGTIHGVVLALHKLSLWLRGRETIEDTRNPLLWPVLVLVNFHIVCIGWVFFRAETFGKAMSILDRIMINAPGLQVPWLFPAVLIPVLLLTEVIQSRIPVSQKLANWPRLSRFVIYFGIALMILLVTSTTPVDFVYFVF